jgi:hypothetical protein
MGFFCFCLGMLLMDDQRACLHVCMHLGDGLAPKLSVCTGKQFLQKRRKEELKLFALLGLMTL